MKRLHKFRSLSSKIRRLLVSTFVLLGLVRLGLWLLPFSTLRQIIVKISQANKEQEQVKQISVEQIIWAVNVSSSYMPGGVKCLARALTTQVFMSRYGYSPELRIGVAKTQRGQLEAHAWVENQGQVVIGNLTDLSRFTPLPSLEGSRL
ncbi:MAG: lasso peptide biosynthesis B2 protein [Nostocaceae cyanobacterium]|nr:lasso peptide biosynthesis B2 protein [Nostocaceae cyanobacterium]